MKKHVEIDGCFMIPKKLSGIYDALIEDLKSPQPVINKILITGAKGVGKTALLKDLIKNLNWTALMTYEQDLTIFRSQFNEFNLPKHILSIDQCKSWSKQNRQYQQIKSFLDCLNNQACLVVIADQLSDDENCTSDFDLVINLDRYYQSSDLIAIVNHYQKQLKLDNFEIDLMKKIINDSQLEEQVLVWEIVQSLKQIKLLKTKNLKFGFVVRNLLMKKLATDRFKTLTNYLEYRVIKNQNGGDENYYSASQEQLIYQGTYLDEDEN